MHLLPDIIKSEVASYKKDQSLGMSCRSLRSETNLTPMING